MPAPVIRQPRGTVSRGQPAAARTTTRAGGTNFAYRPPSAEELRERAQRRGSRDSFFSSDTNFFTPKVGTNSLRILPPPPQKREEWRSYGVELYIHYGIGTDEAGYLCLDKMRGERCPICEERARAKSAGEDEYASQLRPSTRVSVYIIDRDQEGKGPMIWNMPQSLDADICGLAVNKKTGEIYAVDDPENGFDISFNREGQGMITKYKTMQIDRERTPLSEDPATVEKWLEFVLNNPIDEKLQFFEYDYIKAAFAGTPHGPQPEASGGKASPTPAKAPSSAPAAPGGRIRLRGEAPPAKAPQPPEQNEDAPPTYEEIQAFSMDQIGELGAAFNLEFPDTPFDSEAECRLWVCQQLGIEVPPPPPPPAIKKGGVVATGGTGKPASWRTRFNNV